MAGTLEIRGDDGAVVIDLREMLTFPPEGAGDVSIFVSVTCGEFAGSVSAWIGRPQWDGFVAALGELEQTRVGSAEVEALSPEDFRLEIWAVGSAGHLALRGHVGRRRSDGLDCVLHFGFEMDGGLLGQVVRDARSFAPYPPVG